ncbi:MAG TPA: SOS response-associated peptidase [Syntrophales bacterium]|nr:SOS response-associated peptidase [Syntrophales bacterium]HOL59191.1 SOS response-associated peptidase [Syntrophales bacterium]HPO35728.1 SOS response-associated peptidase [Syntrophales bacterium]
MCGRFVLLSNLSRIEDHFGLRDIPASFSRGNNVSPGEKILAVRCHEGRREAAVFRWGFVPSWMKEMPKGGGFINARAESIAFKATFREAFRKRRCLIVADGFYEWQKLANGSRKPWFFYLPSRVPFALAGLFETWVSPRGEAVSTCAIITTQANELISPIHERMPVIIAPQYYDFWLGLESGDWEGLADLLCPYPATEMMSRAEFPVLRIL